MVRSYHSFVASPTMGAGRVVESGRWRWLHVGLARRIVGGVILGVTLILVVVGLVAVLTISEIVDAAGREQVTVAQAIAAAVASTLDARGYTPTSRASGGGDPAALVPRSIPRDLRVQILTSSGLVLADTGGVSTSLSAQHLELLRPLILADEAGYRVHRPGPGDRFAVHVVAYAPLPGYSGLGVVVQQSQPTLLDAPDELLRRLILAGALAIGAAVIVAWIDVHRVTRPLRTLILAAERFAAGDLAEPIAVNRADELGALASGLEVMRRRLRQSLDEIERWNQELGRRVEERTRELERRNRQLAAINAVAASLSESLDLATLLERTLESIEAVTGFDVLAYRLTTCDQPDPLIVARNVPECLSLEKIRPGFCLCGRALQRGQCQVAEALSAELDAAACQRAGVVSAAAVPLGSTDRVEGVLFLGSRQERRFEPEDLDTLAAIGRQVGMALANARLYDALQRRDQERAQLLGQVMDAQEEERRRIAGDLHDQLAQALASILMTVETLAQSDGLSPESRSSLDGLRALVATTLEDTHNLAVDLRPILLDDIGLVAALERLVADFRRRHSLAVDFQSVSGEKTRLLPAAETALFRITQAALSNVARHAAARNVSVLLQRRGDRLILVVEDDGRGFDVAAVRSGPLKDRLGLAGIEERAQLIGAHTTIESAPGQGTTLFVDLSLSENLRPESADAQTPLAPRR